MTFSLTRLLNFCSATYCGFFDFLDKKIGPQKTNVFKATSICISIGTGMQLTKRSIEFLGISSSEEDPALALVYFPAFALSYIIHQYATEALCRNDIAQIVAKQQVGANLKKKAVVMQLLPLNYRDTLEPNFGWDFLLRRQIKKITTVFSVQLFYIQSLKQLDQALDALRDSSISYVYLSGHGTRHTISLANGDFFVYCGEEAYNQNSQQILLEQKAISSSHLRQLNFSLGIMQKMAQKLQEKATVVLSACLTGSGENCIKQGLQKHLPQAVVYAPSGSTIDTCLQESNLIPLYYYSKK